MPASTSFTLQFFPASDLRPSVSAFRAHPLRQREALAASIAECGFVAPVIARRMNKGIEVIDGLLRAQLAGDQQIPVLILEGGDEAARCMRLLLNAIPEMAIDDRVARYEQLKNCAAQTPAGAALLRDLKRRWRPRAASPTVAAPYQPRRHILVECRDEAMQRELFSTLQSHGAPCRLLTL